MFISSTYTDLKEERSAVLKSVLKLRHIPVGMEQFVASNEEQFNYIKKLLEDTDYYIVIIGNRYGSIADDGLSYTEKEFDFAVSLGIPIIACVHSNPDEFPVNKSDTDKKSIEKLKKFRDKVMKNRLVSYINWTTPEALTSEVVVALVNMINDYPRPGWERAGSYDKSDLLSQINELRIENEKYKSRIQNINTQMKKKTYAKAFSWEKKLIIKGCTTRRKYQKTNITVELSWKQIFGILAKVLLSNESITSVHYRLNEELFLDQEPYFKVSDIDYHFFISEFERIGFVNVDGKNIYLTKDGKDLLFLEANKIDEVLESIHQQVIDVINNTEKNSKYEIAGFIKGLSDFNSNPESINYLGETLLGVKVFLANKKKDWGAESVDEALRVIEEILDRAFNDERLESGALVDPIFDLTKVSWLIDYLNQRNEEDT